MRVALLAADYPEYEKYCPNFVGMQDGLRELGIEYTLFSCRPSPHIQQVIDYKPDLVVYCLLDMVKHREWRMAIKKELPNAKIIMWYGDLRSENTGQIDADMSEIDMMFVSNAAQNEWYKKKWKVKDCHFMPLGSSIYKSEYVPKFDFPFVFLGGKITGTSFFDRAAKVVKLENAGLKVINADAQKFPELRAKIMKEAPNIYRSSKVCLDMSHFTDIDSYTSNRYWIITASGGFALTKRFPNCEKFYPEGTRVYFDTLEECLEKVEYYQTHEEEREKIRLAGYEHAKNHTYEKRWKEIFKIIDIKY
jgi:hypothetical protein